MRTILLLSIILKISAITGLLVVGGQCSRIRLIMFLNQAAVLRAQVPVKTQNFVWEISDCRFEGVGLHTLNKVTDSKR